MAGANTFKHLNRDIDDLSGVLHKFSGIKYSKRTVFFFRYFNDTLYYKKGSNLEPDMSSDWIKSNFENYYNNMKNWINATSEQIEKYNLTRTF